MKKIKDSYENEIIINKSKFITHLYRVDSLEMVEEILQKNNKKYYDATHNCYAYIIGDNQEIQKCSDDGEPSKTAGSPILECLKKNSLTNILCIVTRYFGGILLGAGGLIRAYSSSASEALKLAELYTDSILNKVTITISYSYYNALESYLRNYYIIEQSFTSDVFITMGIPVNVYDEFIYYINNASKGSAVINLLGEFKIEIPCDTSL